MSQTSNAVIHESRMVTIGTASTEISTSATHCWGSHMTLGSTGFWSLLSCLTVLSSANVSSVSESYFLLTSIFRALEDLNFLL